MTNRRARLTLAGLALVAFTAVAAPNVFSSFRAVAQSDDIVLTWRSSNETGIQYYDIERRSDEFPDFRRVERISARGSGTSYSYTDDGAFYKPTSGKRFTYRIHATGTSGSTYSPTATVVHEVSSVKRSWGMIKELFR